MADQIGRARKAIPAALQPDYHRALDSLKRWEAASLHDSLGFGPLALLLWGGSILSLAGIGYIFAKVVPEVVPTTVGAVKAVGQVSQVGIWALAALGIYNLATKGKIL